MAENSFNANFEKMFGKIAAGDTAKMIPVEHLYPWVDPDTGKRQPFQVAIDQMKDLQESIEEFGICEALIVRQLEKDKYQIISGERRWTVAGILKMQSVPCTIKKLDDNEARRLLVHTNLLKRDGVLPSERAGAYLLEYTARKNQGKRTDLFEDDRKSEASESGSVRTIQRYMRLNYITPELLGLVDSRKIQMTSGVSLSYFSQEEQGLIYENVYKDDKKLSKSQLHELSDLSKKAPLTADLILGLIDAPKAKHDKALNSYRIYFPKNTSDTEIKNTITTLLEDWRKENLKEILDLER